MPDGHEPTPAGWNRIHSQVANLETEITRLRTAGLTFKSEIIIGPGGPKSSLMTPQAIPLNCFSQRKTSEYHYQHVLTRIPMDCLPLRFSD